MLPKWIFVIAISLALLGGQNNINDALRGVPVATSNFVLGAGWGTTASVTSVIGLTTGFQLTLLSNGTGQANPASVTFTFPERNPLASKQIVFSCTGIDVTSQLNHVLVQVTPSTSLLTTINDIQVLPVAGRTYQISCVGVPQ